jgi:alkylation response protein AidB-like acyl-CoA dehydrogenase
MDFDLNAEQQQLADTVRRWAEKDYNFDTRKKIIYSASGVSDPSWQALAELGVLALPVPEEQGGFNGSAIDMMVVMQELGRALMIEPVFATVLGVQFLKLAGGHEALLERVASGELKLACALGEPQSRHDLHDIATTAVVSSSASGDGYCINGTKSVVLHGAQAGYLIVSARSAGAQRDTAGITLFAVPADAAGIHCQDYRTNDGMRAATITFKDVQVSSAALLGKLGQGFTILDHAADYGVALLAAEAVGAMEALTMATVEYLKTRQQFGVPIGKFQALQHRMADMFMQLEQARSMAMLVAVKMATQDTQERRRTASAAKARIGIAAKFIGQQAVQLHGGMGVTNELHAAHYFKRLSMIELTLGDTDHHLARFAAQPNFKQAA